jgi:hypothetical protein
MRSPSHISGSTINGIAAVVEQIYLLERLERMDGTEEKPFLIFVDPDRQERHPFFEV